ncbi:MAG TPA: aryl-sulfate sulfotransferase [Puia sp.]|nr:aryl-sulfate sulfotransferase [Puia sp.]
MKINILYYRTGIFVAILSSIACHKDNGHNNPVVPKDTLTQDTYTIISGGNSPAATILASPFSSAATPFVDYPGLLLVMDQDGNVLKKKTTDEMASCFERWTINGQTRYSYFLNDISVYRAPGTDNFAGSAVIADSNLQEIKRIHFVPAGTGPFNPGQDLDLHDFILLSDDHYIAMTYYPKHVSNIPAYLGPSPNAVVQVPLIEEVNNGSVIWQWDPSSDTSFYANSVEGNNYADSTAAQDYMHMNAMYIDSADNNIVCSFRNQNQILKINRSTGAILWRLGGKNSDFPLYSDQVFLRQHDPSLTDNNQTLLIFDNGEATLRPESRILEFKLDEKNKKVISFKSFTIPEPFTYFMGSVQKNGDEYFIGGGTANYILEINYVTGEKIKEFEGGSYSTYRAYNFPNISR